MADEQYYQEMIMELRRISGSTNMTAQSLAGLPASVSLLDSSIEDTTKSTKGFGASLKSAASFVFNFGKNVKTAGDLIGGLGLVALGKMIDEQVDAYRNVLDVGQTLGGNFANISVYAAEASMNIDEFSKLVAKSGDVVSTLGIARFAALSNEMRTASTEFGMFGLTVDQINDHFTNYLKGQRQMGVLERISNAVHIKNFMDLNNQMILLAEASGKSREAIEAQADQFKKTDSTFAAGLAKLPAEIRERVLKSRNELVQSFASVSPEFGNLMSTALSESLVTGSMTTAPSMRPFLGMAPDFVKVMEDARKGMLAGEDGITVMTKIVSSMKNLDPKQYAALSQLAVAGGQFSDTAKSILNFKMISDAYNLEALKKQQARQAEEDKLFGETTKALLNFEQNVREVSATVKKIVFEIFGPTLKFFGDNFFKVGDDKTLAQRVQDWYAKHEADFKQIGEDLLSWFKRVIQWIFPNDLLDNIGLPDIDVMEKIKKVVDGLSSMIPTFAQIDAFFKEIGLKNDKGEFDISGMIKLLKENIKSFISELLNLTSIMLNILDKITFGSTGAGAAAKDLDKKRLELQYGKAVGSVTDQQLKEMKNAAGVVGARGLDPKYASAAALINSGIQAQSSTGEDQVQAIMKSYLNDILADKNITDDERANMLDLMRAAGRKTDEMINLLKAGVAISDDQKKIIEEKFDSTMPEIK
jgi:hypothetical protein